MKTEFLCVVCPNGCLIDAELSEGRPVEIYAAKGYRCEQGLKWLKNEVENPMRTISTNMLVQNGNLIAVSVRTSKPIPLASVMKVMDDLRNRQIKAPIRIGDVIVSHPAGEDTDIVATRDVGLRERLQTNDGTN